MAGRILLGIALIAVALVLMVYSYRAGRDSAVSTESYPKGSCLDDLREGYIFVDGAKTELDESICNGTATKFRTAELATNWTSSGISEDTDGTQYSYEGYTRRRIVNAMMDVGADNRLRSTPLTSTYVLYEYGILKDGTNLLVPEYLQVYQMPIVEGRQLGDSLNPLYITDDEKIFRIGVQYADAYPLTFLVEELVGVDPKTFTGVSADYSKDATQVYYHATPIAADATSFSVLIDFPGGFESTPALFAEDAQTLYFRSTPIVTKSNVPNFKFTAVQKNVFSVPGIFFYDGSSLYRVTEGRESATAEKVTIPGLLVAMKKPVVFKCPAYPEQYFLGDETIYPNRTGYRVSFTEGTLAPMAQSECALAN